MTSGYRQHAALPTSEMKVLMAVFYASDDEPLVSSVLAKKAKIQRDCIYVVMGRLRRRGFIKTKQVWMLNANNMQRKFGVHVITPLGFKLARAWHLFLAEITPKLRQAIGW